MTPSEQFNEAAQAFYDLAFERGERYGREQSQRQSARRHALAMLEIAQTVLKIPSGDPGDRQWHAKVARMILGRTPMVADEVTRALFHLRYRGAPVTRDDVQAALGVISDSIERLKL